MGRIKVYENATERQRAHRARAAPKPVSAPVAVTKKCNLSRPKRLAAIEQEVQSLISEYESWAESLPESLADSSQASMLAETIELLTNVADLLGEVNPPRGFGRD